MGSSTVLVVDDEIMTRTMLRMLLEISGYTVVEAEDGVVALQMVAEHHPQAIVLDVMMPELDGISVCKQLKEKEETAVLPIIILSGGKFKDEAIAAGANMYMGKPMSTDKLLAAFAEYTK